MGRRNMVTSSTYFDEWEPAVEVEVGDYLAKRTAEGDVEKEGGVKQIDDRMIIIEWKNDGDELTTRELVCEHAMHELITLPYHHVDDGGGGLESALPFGDVVNEVLLQDEDGCCRDLHDRYSDGHAAERGGALLHKQDGWPACPRSRGPDTAQR